MALCALSCKGDSDDDDGFKAQTATVQNDAATLGAAAVGATSSDTKVAVAQVGTDDDAGKIVITSVGEGAALVTCVHAAEGDTSAVIPIAVDGDGKISVGKISKWTERKVVAAPVIDWADDESLSVVITCATGGAEIFYTTGDGGCDTKYKGGAKIPISETTTVKAMAKKSGLKDSEVTITHCKIFTVTFDLDGGTLGSASTVDAQKVHDGGKAAKPATNPTRDSWNFDGWRALTASGEMAGGSFDFTKPVTSDVALKAAWTEWGKVESPSISWGTGKAVKIECATSDAKIYYTTGASAADIAAPTSASSEYTGEIPISATTFVKAIAVKDGMKDSDVVASEAFNIWNVSFDLDGGKIGSAVAVDAQKVRDKTSASDPGDPAKDGFNFGGWRALTASGEMASSAFDFTKPVTSDVALKAAWTEWGKVESPSISWGTGKAVKIECATSDAKIYYTTGASAADTAAPTAKSAEYTGEISISETTYVKAIAVKEGMKDSDVVASEAFNIWTVSFNLDGGKIGSAVAVDAQKVRDKTSASDPGDPAKDGFNFGGWHEDGVSNAFDFTAAVTRDVSLKAEWTATGKVQKPRISWGTGKAVKIECATSDAKIYYTTGASEAATAAPTSASAEYAGEIPIGETTYVKAIALKDGMTASDAAGDIFNVWNVEFNLNGGDGSAGAQKVRDGALAEAPADNPTKAGFTFKEWRKTGASGAFDFESAPITENTQLKAEWTEWSKVASPAISWGAGKAVKIECATSDAKIYYTTGASEAATAAPTAKSAEYTGEIPISATTFVKAIALKDGMKDSDVVASEAFNIWTVSFDLDGGTGGSTTAAQKVRDSGKVVKPTNPTRDGFTFKEWRKTGASGAFDFESAPITENTQLKAEWTEWSKVASPAISWGTGSAVKIECATSDAKIYYTTGASEAATAAPTAKSDEYTGEIPISATTFVKAIALKDGMKDSDVVASEAFNIWTVSFDLDGGTGGSTTAAQNVRDGASATAPAEDPVKAGFTFSGWYALNSSGSMAGSEFDFKSAVSANVSLKAAWLKAVASVSLDKTTVRSENGRGAKISLAATVLPADAVYDDVRWTVSGEVAALSKTATKSGEAVTLTVNAAAKAGAKITVTASAGGKSDECVVTVVPFDLSNGDAGLLIEAGGEYKFNGEPSGGAFKSIFAKAPKTGAAVSLDFSECDRSAIPDGNSSAPIVPVDAKIKEIALPSNLQKIPEYFAGGVYDSVNSRHIGNETLETISIPDSVTEIGGDAFWGCTKLALTKLPAGLTKICDYAFWGCSSLALTELPAGLTEIGNYAFDGCSKLALTELPAGLTKIRHYAFDGCSSLALTSLPAGVTEIGWEAFRDCTKLALTKLPAGITEISYKAFSSCTKLALTKLPAGLTKICDYAFEDCSSLALTELPAGVTEIGNYAFDGCSRLALTELPAGLTEIGNYAFDGCSRLDLMELPSGVTKIGAYAFDGCTGISRLEIPASVSAVGYDAFCDWTPVQTIAVPFKENAKLAGWDGNWNKWCKATIEYAK